MSFFKKAKSVDRVTDLTSQEMQDKLKDDPPSVVVYELRKGGDWDYDEARPNEYYALYRGYKITRPDGTTVLYGWNGGYANDLQFVASGDKAWADRTAKHFNIEIPE